MIRFVIPAILLLGGCAATPQQVARQQAMEAKTDAELATALVGYTPGKPRICIPMRQQQSTIFGDKILYRAGSNQVFVTNTNGGCFGLRRNDILVTQNSIGQFCQGDIVTTIDPVSRIQTGACAFGEFVPYRKTRG